MKIIKIIFSLILLAGAGFGIYYYLNMPTNCGENNECLAEAAINCDDALFRRKDNYRYLGSDMYSDVSYELYRDGVKCFVDIQLHEAKATLNAETASSITGKEIIDAEGNPVAIDDVYSDTNKNIDLAEGKTGTCEITDYKQNFSDFFMIKPDASNYGDWGLLVIHPEDVCEGELFDRVKDTEISIFVR
jgi:hypothetical protein